MSDLGKYLSVADLERAARKRLPRCVSSYVCGGAEDEAALRENRHAFARVGFVPRGLRDVGNRQQSLTLWGRDYAMPLGIAPTGMAGLVNYEADLSLACAAREARVPFIISGSSNVTLERLQAQGRDCWYQAYLPSDRGRIGRILERIEAAGISVLVVTMDTCVGGNRENMIRAGFQIPFKFTPRLLLDGILHPRWTLAVFARTLLSRGVPRFANLFEEIGPPITEEPAQGLRTGRDKLNWDDLAWIRERWKGRLVLKSVLHPEDARRAATTGADAIMVSNHGGRQLDCTISPLQALPAIVREVPRTPVFMDGGIRRGADIVKGMALGATMVFVGRATLYGAAVAGEAGVKRALNLLREELDRNMALLGCESLDDIGPELLAMIPGPHQRESSG